MTRIKKSLGFTLVELVVVIVIIGILAAVAAVAYNQFISSANTGAADASATDVAKAIGATAALANEATNTGDTSTAGEISYANGANTTSLVGGVVSGTGADTVIEYTSGDASAFICLGAATGVGQVPAVEATADDC